MPRTPDSIEGFWRLENGTSVVEIAPCRVGRKPLCGRLIAFEREPTDRDYLTSDFMSWGQRLCRSEVVTDIEVSRDERVYSGSYYAPHEGTNYNLMLLRKDNDTVEARIYLGASLDEVIDLAIGSALGSAPSLFTSLSFLTRAGVGKELLGETVDWHRVHQPEGRCDRPSIKSTGTPS